MRRGTQSRCSGLRTSCSESEALDDFEFSGNLCFGPPVTGVVSNYNNSLAYKSAKKTDPSALYARERININEKGRKSGSAFSFGSAVLHPHSGLNAICRP